MSIGKTPFQQMVACQGIWKNRCCIWERAGVWSSKELTQGGTPKLLKPHHFACDEPVCDYFFPFVQRFCKTINSKFPENHILINPPAFGTESEEPWRLAGLASIRDTGVLTQHWYDPLTISQKRWIPSFTIQLTDIFRASYKSITENVTRPPVIPVFGIDNAVACHEGAIMEPRKRADQAFRTNEVDEYQVPAIVGETGVPFNCCSTLGFALDDDGYTAMLDRTM